MPRKIRELVVSLERRAGFRFTEEKVAIENSHPRSNHNVILSGQSGADALHYQEKQVKQAIREVQK